MREFDWRSLLRLNGGSVLMIVCGAILAVNPDSASTLISAILGWLLIAVAVALLLAGFVAGAGIRPILFGAVLLAAGAWLHRNPLMIASFLGVLLGLLVLSQALDMAREAQAIKRSGGFWIPGAVLAALELILGLRLIFSPLSVSRLVLTIAGIAMVVFGVCDLAAHHRSHRSIPGDSRIIDADE